MGFVTLQLTSLQLVSTLVDGEQRPQVYVFDTWWTPRICRTWSTVYLSSYQARGVNVDGCVVRGSSKLFCASVSDFDQLLHMPCFFPAGSWRLTDTNALQWKTRVLLTTRYSEKLCEFVSQMVQNIYLSRFMKQLFLSRLVQIFSCVRYYTLSRHRSPKRRKLTWLVAVWTLWMLF